jgi:hypothetical protein
VIIELHRTLALIALAIGAGIGLLAALGALGGRPRRLAVDRAVLAALSVIALAVVSGLGMLLGGQRPHDLLHLLYAAAALLALPIARFGGGVAARHRGPAVAIGGLLVVLLVVRLYQTG